jgi:hypothetical protein
VNLVLHHTEEACKVLKLFTTSASDSSPKSKKSPKQGGAVKKTNSARRRATTKAKTVDKRCVTPKRKGRVLVELVMSNNGVFEVLETISVNTTPPTIVTNGKNALAAPEDFGKLFTLLR